MSKQEVNVALGLIVFNHRVLVGWRGKHQHQGNKNEFPGGKVEKGELPIEACRREILEEVGILIDDWKHVDLICHDYDDICVNLYVYLAELEDSQNYSIQLPWFWSSQIELLTLNFPKANDCIIQQLCHGKYPLR